MMRIAIFVEGQSELIFIRYILFRLYNPEDISFECLALRGNSTHPVPISHHSPNAKFHFMIVNVGNDEKVLTIIREREDYLVNRGFDHIIGLRDMYSKEYLKLANEINQEVIDLIRVNHNIIVQTMNNSEIINLVFAIMEYESWLLAMHRLFQKIDDRLTVDFIEDQFGYDLEQLIPDQNFFHPCNELRRIFQYIGIDYTKHEGQMNSIASLIDDNDLLDALSPQGSPSFIEFNGILPTTA